MNRKNTLIMLILSILFLVSISSAFAGNNTTIADNTPREFLPDSDKQVSATEDGHFNITFDNGYNGYCLEYGEKDASVGDKYIVANTSYAINKNNDENVGNYLKTFFVDYYDVAMEDKVKTQHIIWHFTDDFNGWRVDPELIEDIKLTASKKVIPDEGATLKLNNTTEAVFYFQVLISPYQHHQNFFAYKIVYRNITNTTNTTTENNNTGMAQNNTQNNKTNTNQGNPSKPTDELIKTNPKKHYKIEKSILKTHKTGIEFNILMIILLFLIIACRKEKFNKN